MRMEDITDDVVNKIERILRLRTVFDGRTVGKADIIGWALLVGDLDENAVCEALAAHYQESDELVGPAHVFRRVKAARRNLVERAVLPAPAPELSPLQHRAALQRMIADVASERSLNRAVGLPDLRREPRAYVGKPTQRAIAAPVGDTGGPADIIRDEGAREAYRTFRERLEAARPRPAVEDEDRPYVRASAVLRTYDDLGQAFIARAAEELGEGADDRAVVLRAAELAIDQERQAS